MNRRIMLMLLGIAVACEAVKDSSFLTLIGSFSEFAFSISVVIEIVKFNRKSSSMGNRTLRNF